MSWRVMAVMIGLVSKVAPMRAAVLVLMGRAIILSVLTMRATMIVLMALRTFPSHLPILLSSRLCGVVPDWVRTRWRSDKMMVTMMVIFI